LLRVHTGNTLAVVPIQNTALTCVDKARMRMEQASGGKTFRAPL
jgi:hypothetical protein